MTYVSTWRDRSEEILAIASMVKDANPQAWAEIQIHGQKSRTFINLVSMSLINAGIPGGVNLKRGGPDQSIDAIALPNATGAKDATGKYSGLEIIDIVGNAETPAAAIGWNDVTLATMIAGVPGGWKAGSLTPQAPPTPPVPIFPYPDEVIHVLSFQTRVKGAYREAGRMFPDPNDSDAYRHFVRYGYSCGRMDAQAAEDKHIAELRTALGLSVP